jgi:hypothetical protein
VFAHLGTVTALLRPNGGVVSLYQLHRCVYDFVRAGEVGSGEAAPFEAGRYELTDDERHAFETADIAALYRMGLHPVLLNRFCRAVGYTRDGYRKLLEPLAEASTGSAPWRT